VLNDGRRRGDKMIVDMIANGIQAPGEKGKLFDENEMKKKKVRSFE